ncbi:MAG: hypothetical protein IIT40_09920, partial [Prevotella sp.]|nr:hypothetical protein [Prevotella sp.]
MHPEFEDSIFTWRYYSDNSFGHRANKTQPNGNPYTGDETGANIFLKFDPGWNGYYDELGVQQDMATMFVPSDEAMWTYFESGGGLQLIETYGDPTIEYNGDYEKLYENIDQIPISTLTSLINVIMCRSFVGSVPSKMTKLRDDAQEQLFYAEDIDKIDTCLLACNGAVYIMDDIYGPADYTSVTSPAYISKTNLVMKWAIYNGSDAGTDYMGLNYYAYLKAMQSEFTFFLPSDQALNYYYDPTSFKSTQKRLIQFSYKNQAFPIVTRCINYNPTTGEIGRAFTGAGASISQSETTNRLKDMLESHTIVHDGTNPIHGEDVYFLTKNGSAVKVERDENGSIINVKGGFQLENEREGIFSEEPGVDICNVTKPFDNLKNGQTYILDAPIIPTSRSVYSILTQEEGWSEVGEEQWEEECPYSEFYKLCETNDEIVRACGLVDETNLSTSEQRSAQKKFDIFVAGDQYNKMYGLDYDV